MKHNLLPRVSVNTVVALIGFLISLEASGQRMIRSTNWDWINASWSLAAKQEYNYDNGGQMDSIYDFGWINNSWQLGAVHSSTFSAGLLTEMMSRSWNTSTSAWDPQSYSTCSYTTANKFWQQVFYGWNGSTWVNEGKNENTYDQNLFTIKNTNYIWKYNAYQNNVQLTYSNNAVGDATFTMVHHWDTLNNSWVTNSRMFTAYSGTTVVDQYQEFWWQNAWVPQSQATVVLNTNNKIDSSLYRYYYTNAWHNSTLYTYTYGATEDYTVVTHLWDFAANTWTIYARTVVEFELPAPTSLPGVLTLNLSGIGISSVACTGDVTSDGGTAVTARGFVFSTSANPTLSNNSITAGNGLGSFTGTLTGLSPGTLYYVRAFATNSVGTIYGTTKLFTTAFLPTGINETEVTTLHVFPSPATNIVTITGLKNGTSIQLIDVKGSLVSTSMSNGESVSIDVSSLPSGSYFVRTEKGELRRFVKE